MLIPFLWYAPDAGGQVVIQRGNCEPSAGCTPEWVLLPKQNAAAYMEAGVLQGAW